MSHVADIRIGGDVHGQVAAGNFVYQAQSVGGVINQYTIEGEVIVARSGPLYERPPRRDAFVGRVSEIEELLDELERGPVQVFGDDGVGKTWLVGHVTHHQRAHDRRDGIAYVDARRGPLEDVLQALFDVFFDSRLPQIDLKATPTQIRQAMADREAFVVVDHLDVARSDVDYLLQVLVRCTVVLASDEETLFGSGSAIPLRGLDPSAAVALFAQEARRDLEAEEAGEVEWYCSAVGGHPLTILRTARQLRRGEITVSGLRGLAAQSGVGRLAVDGLAERVDRDEQSVLSALAAVTPEALPPEAVSALAGTGDAAPVLAEVADRGIVRAASPRYRLPPDAAAALGLGDHLDDWREHVLVTLPGWVRDADAELVADAAGAIEAIVAWGHGAGRSGDVSALARAAAPQLATARRWGSLRRVLDHAHRAAESAGDRSTVGWALHELGTLDACSDELTRARELLTHAEAIRRDVGTAAEVEVTRHNLEQLNLVMAGPKPEPPPDGWPRWLKLLVGTIAAVAIALVVLVVVATSTGENGDGGDDGGDDGGRAAAGFLDIDESPIDFGPVLFGEATVRERSLTNAGDAAVEIQAIAMVSGDQFEVGNNCPAPLDPGETCTVAVAFTAREPGEWVDRLVITSDAENREVSVDVFGVVGDERVEPTAEPAAPAEIAFEPDAVDFGFLGVGEAARVEVVLVNVGGQPLELFERGLAGDRAFELDDGCPDVLGPGEECSLLVVFPGSGGGSFEDVLFVRHSAPQPTVEIPIVAVSVIE